jgi:hypothetical protein
MKKILSLIKSILLSPRAFCIFLGYCCKQYRYNNLLQFAIEEETDKGVPGHNYVRVYDAFLRNRRDSISSLCEIGLLLGRMRKGSSAEHPEAPSLRMWRKYLPYTQLVGFDILRFENPDDENCTILQGDQGSREELQKIIECRDTYDVIIDDALHASPHQQITLSYLFPHLASGGLYFIEDLRHQPDGFEQDDVPKTRDLLREFSMTGRWNSPLSTPEEKRFLEQEIREVHLFESLKGANPVRGADAIAVLVKR